MSNTLGQIAFLGTGECIWVNYLAQVITFAAIIAAPVIYFFVVKGIVQSRAKHGCAGKVLGITIFTLAFIWFAGVVVFSSFILGLCSGPSMFDFLR